MSYDVFFDAIPNYVHIEIFLSTSQLLRTSYGERAPLDVVAPFPFMYCMWAVELQSILEQHLYNADFKLHQQPHADSTFASEVAIRTA
jgi:hypothetical protein